MRGQFAPEIWLSNLREPYNHLGLSCPKSGEMRNKTEGKKEKIDR
jgi:hypothetical protein